MLAQTRMMVKWLCFVSCLFSAKVWGEVAEFESALLRDIKLLADDQMQGRKTGHPGAELARRYIEQRYQQLKLLPLQEKGFRQVFSYSSGFTEKKGMNVIGWRQGCVHPSSYVVITAHYDHLGMSGSRVYNGADDNASGVATMLALAALLGQSCPAYSYIFAATDAEENGLYGAKALLRHFPVAAEHILLNLNLDMLSRGERSNQLYVYGARSLPGVSEFFKQRSFAVKIKLRRQGRQQGQSGTDWDNASDHAPFRRAGIPFLYFGVDTHADYHSINDDWQRIDSDFLQRMFSSLSQVLLWLDQQPPEWYQAARKP